MSAFSIDQSTNRATPACSSADPACSSAERSVRWAVAKQRAVTVFCGSGLGSRDAYRRDAQAFGTLLGENGITLVYGGGRTGLMGELADAALAAGGTVIGVIPKHLVEHEVAHEGLSELLIVDDMHQRKARLGALGDCYVALPGGSGTLEEFFEVWTWKRIGLHRKTCALLNTLDYWEGLITMLRRMGEEAFLHGPDIDELVIEASPQRLLDRL